MIAVVGESLIDFIAQEERADGQTYDSHVGGCGLNTATAIARLETPVIFLGGISADMFGKRIIEHLVRNQALFDPDLCCMAVPSMLAFANVDSRGAASYAFYCRGTAPMVITEEQLCSSFSENKDIRIVHIGSVSLTMRPASRSILDSVQFMDPHPVVCFDPNIRPAVIDDMQAYLATFWDAARMSDIIKLSDDDLSLVFPQEPDFDSAAAALRNACGAHIVITRGAQGSVWYTPDGRVISHEAATVDVVDTVGAGDTFGGAILSYIYSHGLTGVDGEPPVLATLDDVTIAKILAFATQAAAVTCSRAGCNPPTLKELGC